MLIPEMDKGMQSHVDHIRATALKILEEVGIRLMGAEALDLLRENGVRVEGDRAFFLPGQVMDWVERAPSRFTIHARNPRHDMLIGGDESECSPGYGCASLILPDGSRRDTVLSDYVTLAKLVQQSGHFKINGGILAQPADVDPERSHLIMLYAAILSSDKCLLGIPGTGRHINEMMEAAAFVFGGKDSFTSRPHLLTMISTVSPLQVDEMALDSILTCARCNQPMIISPAPAAGTTGPVDLGVNLSLATAEALACIALAQMARPGVPVIFGLQCYGADLRTGNISIGSPAYALQAGYCAALARSFNLPSRAGGTTNDAKDVSVQTGYESMLSMLTALQNRINLIVHSAGILDSFAAMSYEKFMVDLEIMDMARYYLRGLPETDYEAGLQLIKSVGPGGQFLTTRDTMKKCRTHSWAPEVALRGSLSGRTPGEALASNIQKKMERMLASYVRPELEPARQAALEDYLVNRAGVDPAALDAVKKLLNPLTPDGQPG